MKKFLFPLLILFLIPFFSNAQPGDIEKRVKKINKYVKNNKIDKASEMLEDLLDDYPGYGNGWDLLSRIRYFEWEESKKNNLFGNITVSVEGDDEEAKEKAEALAKLLNGISSSDLPYKRFINTLREGTLKCNTAYQTSIFLRNEKVAMDADTNISEDAMEDYTVAEKNFMSGNYETAAEYYEKALKKEPNFYKAELYLGDAYYFMQEYEKAIDIFKKVKNKYPSQLKPRIFLVDAYSKDGSYKACMKEAIEGFTIYPDYNMYAKLKDAVKLNDKEIEDTWIPRVCYPNKIGETSEEIKVTNKENPWYYYQNAKASISDYCDENGLIIKENDLTEAKYLEVYSWEKMLAESDNEALNDAKKMQELGYLDCYVMVTCFHQDFYEQFKHFSANNKERITAYFDLIIK